MQASEQLSNPFGNSAHAAASCAAVGTSSSQFLNSSYKIADVLIAGVSVLGAFILTNLAAMPGHFAGFLALRVSVKNLLLMAFFTLVWSTIFRVAGLYQNQNRKLHVGTILRLIAVSAMGGSFAVLFVITSRAGAFRLDTVLVTWLLAVSLAIGVRIMLNALSGPGTSWKHQRQVLIMGSGGRALRLYRGLNARPGADYRVLGFVDSAAHSTSREIREMMLGEPAQLEDILVNNVVDEVLITLPVKSCYTQIWNAIQVCERIGVESKYLSEIFEPSFTTARSGRLEGFSVTSLQPVVDDARFVIKRAVDLIGAGLGLTLLSPVFLLIAVAIRLSSSGPAIFGQDRHGRNRRRFKIYKFRTMIHNAEALQPSLEPQNEANGPVFKIRDDPRITRIGMILRRSSLDELPQLFNVLKGEMSLVGPRPLPTRDVSRFEEGWLLRRFCVLPGLTGLWQVRRRGSTKFEDWVQQDFEYIDNWSLKLDLQILAKTIPAVLKRAGAM
jgi:exopolysaccharide biosynthesis polyprenyl glycosylphosphotransferase